MSSAAQVAKSKFIHCGRPERLGITEHDHLATAPAQRTVCADGRASDGCSCARKRIMDSGIVPVPISRQHPVAGISIGAESEFVVALPALKRRGGIVEAS